MAADRRFFICDNFQGVHQAAQAVQKRLPRKLGQGLEALVHDFEVKPALPAAYQHGHVAGQKAVAAPASVNFRAFQQNSIAIAHAADKNADRCFGIGWQIARMLAYPNQWFSFVHACSGVMLLAC